MSTRAHLVSTLLFVLALPFCGPGCDPNPTAPTAPSSADPSKAAPPAAPVKGKNAGGAVTPARPID